MQYIHKVLENFIPARNTGLKGRERVQNERRLVTNPPNSRDRKQADKTTQVQICAIFHEKR